jgi:LemA protein
MTGFLVIAAGVVVLAMMMASMYNGLVRLRNQVRNSWAQIDVQLKRRHDLIPNLVETVKGFAGHEQETLDAVTKARYTAVDAKTVGEQSAAEQNLSGALGRLMLIVENYPDLKANQNFLALQAELSSTENEIGRARQQYNQTVMQMNTRVESFPTNLVAGMFGFKSEEFFEVTATEERDVPKVEF